MKERCTKMKRQFLALFVAVSSIAVSAATVDRILVRQEWPWNERVDIDFALSGVSAKTEIDCAVYRGGTRIDLPLAAFSGDVCNLSKDGLYRIVFDPSFLPERPAAGKESLRFVLTPAATTDESAYGEVMYKIVDLESPYSIVDVTRGDILSGEYGSYETDYGRIGERYSTSLTNVLIWTGVTNKVEYKTSKMVFRRIPAGSFTYPTDMAWGATAKTCTITNDYFIGVFEVTQGQYKRFRALTNNYASVDYYNPLFVGDELPVNRGAPYSLTGGNARSAKHSAGKIGAMNRAIGHNHYITLPTKGQWLYAMRAGTDTYYYDGLGGGAPEDVSRDARLDVLGRYAGNGGMIDNGDGTITTNGVVAVGSYRPNAYGIYDMLGNVIEVLFETSGPNALAGKTGLVADVSSNGYVLKGGGWSQNAAVWPFATTTRNMHSTISTRTTAEHGFRLVLWVDSSSPITE